MLLAIPYSHTDIQQALRVLRWIGWLSKANHGSMKKESVLLVPSKHAAQKKAHRQICTLAAAIFGVARCYALESEYERGWPGACNFMLKETLEHVEQHFRDDIFLLEPDAIPLFPAWFDEIKGDWRVAKIKHQVFMGNHVPYDIPHMTGIGVYGGNWRSVSPKLAVVQDERGWDTFAADEILPNAHITPLIQHHWWRMSATPYEAMDLGMVSPEAAVFHQDKQGRLIKLLDDKYFDGAADRAVGYSRHEEEKVMMHYFLTFNANRAIRSQGYEFRFDMLEQIGGVWHGIYHTDNESEVLALQAISGLSGSVRELTVDEYGELTKKKAPISNVSNPLQELPRPEGRINQSPAVLVDGPVKEIDSTPIVEDIEDVLKVGKVTQSELSQAAKNTKTRKRK